MCPQIPEKTKEIVYQEAGHWLRMANTLTWSIGAIFMPMILGAVVLALRKEKCSDKLLLAGGSFLVWFVWFCMIMLYRRSTAPVRTVLETIESEWGLDPKNAFYSSQGPLFNKPMGPKDIMVIFTIVLLLGWIIVLWPCICKPLACICSTLE